MKFLIHKSGVCVDYIAIALSFSYYFLNFLLHNAVHLAITSAALRGNYFDVRNVLFNVIFRLNLKERIFAINTTLNKFSKLPKVIPGLWSES